MSDRVRVIAPFAERLAAGRPVLAQNQVTSLAKRILDMTSADMATVSVTHTARVVTRMANDQVLSSDDGDDLRVTLGTKFGDRHGVNFTTNQLDDSALRAVVERCEALARQSFGGDEEVLPH